MGTNNTISRSSSKLFNANKALDLSMSFWFTIAVIGQWIFAYYVIFFYGGSAIKGNFEKWNEVLPTSYEPGNILGNTAIIIHLAVAVIIMISGPLQFIPVIRKKAPKFHRLNGKLYIGIAFLASLSGIYMIATHDSITGIIGDIALGINALLIMLFAILALNTARARKFNKHRHWAMRLFLCMNAVWFFRIGLMFWLFINKGPVGFDPETFRGPFITFLSLAQFLLPLGILELYLLAQNKKSVLNKYLMSIGMIALTVCTGLGIFMATMGMWLPRL